jgi:hypothetical protein
VNSFINNTGVPRTGTIRLADYTVMGMEFADNLLLISRASSDAYEPYVFLKGHSEKSSNPDGQNDLL